MKLPVRLHQPFGPHILETTCPKNIMDALNKKVEEICSDPEEMIKYCSSKGNIPNLLLRDLEVVYFAEDFLEEIGFVDFVETLGNYYLENVDNKVTYQSVKLSVITPDSREVFKLSEDVLYSDAWVNRYYKGDYTPYHDHGSELAGVVVLKVPEELHEVNMKNSDSEGTDNHGRLGGKVQFIHGGNFHFSYDEYIPDQDEGTVLIFPSWLSHMTYPLPVNTERRSLSFNLVSESGYYDRLNGNEKQG